MFLSRDEVQRYEQWENSPPGRFALRQELKLLFCLMSQWPRRKQSLLDVGCGTGFFLNHFWQTGFEVTGLDRSPPMLAKARERLGNRADLHLGQADHLPFADKEFDFVTLLTVLEFCQNPGAVVAEAGRVARKGLVIGFLNRCSLYYLTKGKPWRGHSQGSLTRAGWLTSTELKHLVRQRIGPRPLKAGSVLAGPQCTWKERLPWRFLNGLLLPVSCGAYGGLRVDLVGEKCMTPLLAWKAQPKPTQ